INTINTRSTVEETYNQIINDLTFAVDLLKEVPTTRYSPSKPAALGLLARIYLSMRKYDKALEYADLTMAYYGTLIDYNNLNLTTRYSIPRLNEETIWYGQMSVVPLNLANGYSSISNEKFSEYSSNDLRKVTFFYIQNG